jgi:hypothetical protein
MRALLASILALSLAADSAYPCARPNLTDKAITPDGTVIPSGGGVVITTVNGFNGGGGDIGMGAQLVAGGVNIELERKYIAPALTVIVAKPQANRAIELATHDGKTLLSLTQSDVAPKHTAPKVKAVHSTLPPSATRQQQRWEPTSQYTIELAEAPPNDVLALVVRVGDSGIAWAAPQKGQTSYSFYAGGKRCTPGPMTLAQGSKVTVAWLDVGGRLSVTSKEIRVGVTPKAKQP